MLRRLAAVAATWTGQTGSKVGFKADHNMEDFGGVEETIVFTVFLRCSTLTGILYMASQILCLSVKDYLTVNGSEIMMKYIFI